MSLFYFQVLLTQNRALCEGAVFEGFGLVCQTYYILPYVSAAGDVSSPLVIGIKAAPIILP